MFVSADVPIYHVIFASFYALAVAAFTSIALNGSAATKRKLKNISLRTPYHLTQLYLKLSQPQKLFITTYNFSIPN